MIAHAEKNAVCLHGRMRFDHAVMDEEVLLSQVMLVPGVMLRRWVARALWFDLCDQVAGNVCMARLKEIADPERLDDAFEFTADEYGDALRVAGYTELQIAVRVKIHTAHRSKLEQGTSLTELRRCTEFGGAKSKYSLRD